jgi:hypothetical protein
MIWRVYTPDNEGDGPFVPYYKTLKEAKASLEGHKLTWKNVNYGMYFAETAQGTYKIISAPGLGGRYP